MKEDTYIEFKLLKNIVLLNIKEEITFKELAEKLNIKRVHPYFMLLTTRLIRKDIIKNTRTIGGTKLIKINNKKLIDYIYDSKFFNEEIVKFIAFVNPLHNI